MRRHVSVFMLYVRSSLPKLLILLLLMTAAELGLFYVAVNDSLMMAMVTLEEIFDNSYVPVVMAAAFVLLTVQLCSVGCEFGSKQGYTLRRLSISEGRVFLWQALFNASAYFVLMGVQLLLVLFMCAYGAKSLGAYANGQTVFLAFYRHDFLHGLLPLEEWTRYLRNFIMVFGLGSAAALFPFHQRRKKIGFSAIISLPVTIFGFCNQTGNLSTDIILMLYYLVVIIWSLYRVFTEEVSLDEA